jgi:hypothetical protein
VKPDTVIDVTRNRESNPRSPTRDDEFLELPDHALLPPALGLLRFPLLALDVLVRLPPSLATELLDLEPRVRDRGPLVRLSHRP